jgi:RNA polymerase sigma-70 factor (ECF subfamily)
LTAPAEVARIVDHLFRREAGRLVAILTRRFGVAHLPLAEDVVQDALVKAMQVWPYTGVPQHPTAWLIQTAKNRALDHTRRTRVWRDKHDKLLPLVEDCLQGSLSATAPQFEDEIHDAQLRMMFVCSHPGLPPEAQVALILKVLCGFGEREIAAAFLATEDAVAKRLVRARCFLREAGVAVELPPAAELAPRVATVQQALYLLFNEGYKASHGDTLLRADLCAEAIRLGELLVAHPLGDRAATHALLALMHLNAARLPARQDEAGNILLLAGQDRTKWDRENIRLGLAHLDASRGGDEAGRFHLEAGIAACHCLAPDYAATNWAHILGLYDRLLALDRSPVVALNRAVALARVRGPAAGLRALEEMAGRHLLKNYHLLHAVAGSLWLESGDRARAAAAFRRAHELAPTAAERDFLARQLAAAG